MDQSINVMNWIVFIALAPAIVFLALGVRSNKHEGKNIFSNLREAVLLLGAIFALVIAVNVDRGVGWFSRTMLVVSWVLLAFLYKRWWLLWKQRSHG